MAVSRREIGWLLAAAFVFGSPAVQAQAPSFESVLAGARQEGGLVLAFSSPGLPATQKALIEGFNKRFNLNVKAEWTAPNPVQTGVRLISEKSRGRASVDVIAAGGAEEIAALAEHQILQPYPWAGVFGKELPQMAEIADRAIPDVRGMGLPILDAVYGIAWNPDLIKDADVPNTYAELLNPAWHGRIAINALSLNPVDFYVFELGRDATLDMARKVLDLKPVLERGSAAAARAVAVGQAPVGVVSYHLALRAGTPEKPLRFKPFSDYIILNRLYTYVPQNSPNPNTARLFAAWLVTEGVAVAGKTEPVPRIGDAGSELTAMVEKQRAATKPKTLEEHSFNESKQASAIRNSISRIMTGQAP